MQHILNRRDVKTPIYFDKYDSKPEYLIVWFTDLKESRCHIVATHFGATAIEVECCSCPLRKYILKRHSLPSVFHRSATALLQRNCLCSMVHLFQTRRTVDV